MGDENNAKNKAKHTNKHKTKLNNNKQTKQNKTNKKLIQKDNKYIYISTVHISNQNQRSQYQTRMN